MPQHDPTTTKPSEQITARLNVLSGALGAIGAWWDTHPEVDLAIGVWCGTDTIYAFARSTDDFTAWATALKDGAPIGSVQKSKGGDYFNVSRTFGPMTVQVTARHELVCERVVVGTETVAAPDPAAVAALPLVEQVVEKVEWRCPPILAHVAPPVEQPPARSLDEALAGGEAA